MTQTLPDMSQEAIAECVSAVVRSRRTTRAFKQQPLSRAIVEDILRDASCAPSMGNVQPWKVYVLTGQAKEGLSEVLGAAFHAGDPPPPSYFPDPLPEVYRARLVDFGARFYGSLQIDRSDAAGRARQTAKNFSFFDAPVGLIFTIDRRLKSHSWIDLGLLAQNIMISAKARGIDTCPQVSFALFPDEIASYLKMPPEDITAFGMSMGYRDPEAPVNQVKMPRESVQDFAQLLGFSAP